MFKDVQNRTGLSGSIRVAGERERGGARETNWTIGLEVSVGPPHMITAVADVLDKHGTEKGMPGYANKDVCPGDVILRVNGAEVESRPVATLNRALKGELNTAVSLELRSATTDKTYSITVLRHACLPTGSPPLSLSGKENATRAPVHNNTPIRQPDMSLKIPQLIHDSPPSSESPSVRSFPDPAADTEGSVGEEGHRLSPSMSSLLQLVEEQAARLEKLETEKLLSRAAVEKKWGEEMEKKIEKAVERQVEVLSRAMEKAMEDDVEQRMANMHVSIERQIEEAVEMRTTTMVEYVLETQLQPRLRCAMEEVLHTENYRHVLDERLSVVFEDILQGIRDDGGKACVDEGSKGSSAKGSVAPRCSPCQPGLQEGDEPIGELRRASLGSLPCADLLQDGSLSIAHGVSSSIEEGGEEEEDDGGLEGGEGESFQSARMEQDGGDDDDEEEDAASPPHQGGSADEFWGGEGCDEQTLQVKVDAVTQVAPVTTNARVSPSLKGLPMAAASPGRGGMRHGYVAGQPHPQPPPGVVPGYVAHYYM